MRDENRAPPILDQAASEWNNPVSLERLCDHHAVEKLLPHAGKFVEPHKMLAAEAGFQAQLNRCNEFVECVDRFGLKLNGKGGLSKNQESSREDGGPLEPVALVEEFDRRQQIGEFASTVSIVGSLSH